MSNVTPDQASEMLSAFMMQYANNLENAIKAKTPVLSGRLRDGWSVEVSKDEIIILNPVEYTAAVEYGTVSRAPVGMVSTTLAEAELIAVQTAEKVGLTK